MKQRHRKAHVVRRQDMDRLMRLIVAMSNVRMVRTQINRMVIQVFRRDAEVRTEIYRAVVDGIGEYLLSGTERA